MNIVVVTVYWSLLHNDALLEAAGNTGKIINCYWVHLMPGFSIMANFAMTHVVLRSSHVKALPVVAILYGVNCYYETKKLGRPLYSFMTFEDSSTYWIYGGMIAGFSLVYLGLAQVSVAIKESQVKRSD